MEKKMWEIFVGQFWLENLCWENFFCRKWRCFWGKKFCWTPFLPQPLAIPI